MKRKLRNNKIIVVALVILIFSSVGAGYAYWTDEIKTDATVSTGKLQPSFKHEGIFPPKDVYIPIQDITVVNNIFNRRYNINDPVSRKSGYNVIKLSASNIGNIPIRVLKDIEVVPNNDSTFKFELSFNTDFDKLKDDNIIKNKEDILYNKDPKSIYLKVSTENYTKGKLYTVKIPYTQFNLDEDHNGWIEYLELPFKSN